MENKKYELICEASFLTMLWEVLTKPLWSFYSQKHDQKDAKTHAKLILDRIVRIQACVKINYFFLFFAAVTVNL